MAIHNRHDFHAFSALRRSDFRPATFGHNERRIDEADAALAWQSKNYNVFVQWPKEPTSI